MTKTFIKYLLSLSIFLLGGYSQLAAHTSQEDTCLSLIKRLKKSEGTGFGTIRESQDLSRHAIVSSSKQEGVEIEAEDIEEEDDLLTSFERKLSSGNLFAAIFNAQAAEFLFSYIRKCLRDGKPFLYINPYSRQIIFQVFKI
ncbi:hypothetical protein AAG747_24555 [Rapidithrix thailandica]|uniref:Uncharacterized protein n=1 Tax=Rapidithrix thailandica TaxID=413964 RepID=A0AAW9SDK4_9BACT